MKVREDRSWTPEGIEVLKELLKNHTHKEIMEILERDYDTVVTNGMITNIKTKLGLKSGTNRSWFKKGQTPWNKGVPMSDETREKVKDTWFQKGNTPWTHRPLGSTRITKEGATEVKIAEPNVWDYLHRLVYELHHGKIPEGHIVVFKDNDTSNCEPDNLILVNRRYWGAVSKRGYHKFTGEAKEVAVRIAELSVETKDRRRKNARTNYKNRTMGN